jgi:hypothetical protein
MAREIESIQICTRAVTDWFNLFVSDRPRRLRNPGVVADLENFISEARMIRWSMITTEMQVAELWERIMPGSVGELGLEEDDEFQADGAGGMAVREVTRINEDIIDFVMNGTMFMLANSALPGQFFIDMVGEIAKAITWPARSTAIVDEVKSRAALMADMKKLLEDNGWILFLYFLSIAPVNPVAVPLIPGTTLPEGEE